MEKYHAGCITASILEIAVFNLCLNDICGVITNSKLYIYTDDNTLLATGNDRNTVQHNTVSLNGSNIIDWYSLNYMEANPTKFQAKAANDTELEYEIDLEGNKIKGESQG